MLVYGDLESTLAIWYARDQIAPFDTYSLWIRIQVGDSLPELHILSCKMCLLPE